MSIFACKRTIFDVPLLAVGTEFQRTVWQELQNIPYGKTVSYGELSRKLGNPKAVRAVAAANGANALSILIPCHRVVGSNHTLIGYAGGLAAKQGMLALECGLLRRTVRLPYRTAVLRSGLFLVFRRCHPRHTFEEL